MPWRRWQMSNSKLSLRLLIAAAFSTFVAVALTGLVINYLFERFYEDQIGLELENELKLLTASVIFDGTDQPAVSDLKNEAYMKPLSGRYWQVMGVSGQSLYSESLWDQTLPIIKQARDGKPILSRVEYFDSEILMISWWVKFEDAVDQPFVQISVARDLVEGSDAAVALKKNAFQWLVILAVALTLATWVQVYVGLKPLERIRAEIKNLNKGHINKLSDNFPHEVQPLVNEVNLALKSKDNVIERARHGAGNLAHGLKTPLTIINSLLANLSVKDHGDLTQDIRGQITNMNEIIEGELARVRTNEKPAKWTQVENLMVKIIQTMKRLPRGNEIQWQVHVDANFEMPFDEHDFAELAGNILDNARKFTKSAVLIKGRWVSDQEGSFTVEDDGDGIPLAQMKDALNRGERLHNQKSGHGIGLSIVNELARSASCDLNLSKSELGGLKITVKFQRR